MDRKSAVLALAAAAAAGVIIGAATIWASKRESDSADGAPPDDGVVERGPASDAVVRTAPSTSAVNGLTLAEAATDDRSTHVVESAAARSPPTDISPVTRHLPSAAPRDPVQVKKLLRQFLDAGEEGMLEQALRGAQQHSAYKALQDVSIRIGVLQELCACAQRTSHALLAQTLTVLANYASNGASHT
jgi:hypothetical protein